MVVLLLILEPQTELLEALLWGALPGAIGAALVVWPLGVLLTRLDRAVDPHSDRKARGLF